MIVKTKLGRFGKVNNFALGTGELWVASAEARPIAEDDESKEFLEDDYLVGIRKCAENEDVVVVSAMDKECDEEISSRSLIAFHRRADQQERAYLEI